MATGMHMDERSVDCLVLGHYDQDRKVSAKSVTMRAMTLCKNLSGYRELLLIPKMAYDIYISTVLILSGIMRIVSICLFVLLLYVPGNSYGLRGTVSLPNHTFF